MFNFSNIPKVKEELFITLTSIPKGNVDEKVKAELDSNEKKLALLKSYYHSSIAAEKLEKLKEIELHILY